MEKPLRSNGSTIREVAEAAGVSVASVSKVLHGRGKNIRVSEARAITIREVAEKLRYSPNALARSLRTSRTQTVGLVWEHMKSIADGPLYYVNLLDGVANTLFSHHYSLTILPELPAFQPIRSLSDGRLDGLIWCKMPQAPELDEELDHTSIRVVALNALPPACPGTYPVVNCDNEGGAALVVEHLADLGHRKILFAFDGGWDHTPDALARLKGFRDAMHERGLEFDDRDIVEWQRPSESFADWYRQDTGHTAIFGWHEAIAANILIAAQDAGVNVPEDLSVVGFDSTRFCESTSPRLTAVQQPIREMAALAAQVLLGLIEGIKPVQDIFSFPCKLDIRDSTCRPAASRAESRRGEN
jgi:LacI family transcriptional regulator